MFTAIKFLTAPNNKFQGNKKTDAAFKSSIGFFNEEEAFAYRDFVSKSSSQKLSRICGVRR